MIRYRIFLWLSRKMADRGQRVYEKMQCKKMLRFVRQNYKNIEIVEDEKLIYLLLHPDKQESEEKGQTFRREETAKTLAENVVLKTDSKEKKSLEMDAKEEQEGMEKEKGMDKNTPSIARILPGSGFIIDEIHFEELEDKESIRGILEQCVKK